MLEERLRGQGEARPLGSLSDAHRRAYVAAGRLVDAARRRWRQGLVLALVTWVLWSVVDFIVLWPLFRALFRLFTTLIHHHH